jgi:spermidine synthase
MISRIHIAILTTLFTGATGLVYEVTWQRYLSNLLGSEARATSIIIGVFLSGLTIGYSLFGKVSKKISGAQALTITGVVEVCIGIWALFFPSLFRIAYSQLGLIPYNAPVVVDAALATLAIGAPTVAMGATLPLLTQALSKNAINSKSVHATIYATNTFGAFGGAILAGFALIPAFGLPGTMYLGAAVNIVMGLVLLKLGPPETGTADKSQDTESSDNASDSISSELSIAFIAGFCSIGLQTALMRVLALSAGGSEYTFAMVVGAFILLLALGAATVNLAHEIGITLNLLLTALGLCTLAVGAEYAPYLTHVLRTSFSTTPIAFYLYFGALFVALTAALAPTVLFMGRTMPLIFRSLVGRSTGIGSLVGRLYFLNTLGCVAGALVCGYFGPQLVGIEGIFVLLIGLTLTAATISATHRLVPAVLLSTLAACIGTPNFLVWNPRWISSGFYRLTTPTPATFSGPEALSRFYLGNSEFIFRQDDPQTTVTVLESKTPAGQVYRSLLVNGKSDGTTHGADLKTTLMLGHLPALFFKAPQNAAVVGFGTGITVGALLQHESVQNIDVIEISNAVQDAADLFGQDNHNANHSTKVNWIHGDAYRVLGRAGRSYDLIVSEPSNPWIAGIERLFADDFYKLVRSRLSSGGIYAQWFHTYYMSKDTLAMVLATFRASFPNVRIFQNDIDLVLLGSQEALNLSTFISQITEPAVNQDLARAGLASPDEVLSLELPLPELSSSSPIQTLENPRLAFQAGRDFFASRDTAPEVLIGYFDRPALSKQMTKLFLQNPERLAGSWCSSFNGLLCRIATAAMAAKGLGDSTAVASLAALKNAAPTTPLEAAALLGIYRDYSSPWIELSDERLRLLAEAALSDPSHNATVYEALAFNLRLEVLQSLPPPPNPRLRQLVRMAVQAKNS